jgi:putative heme degradation protein
MVECPAMSISFSDRVKIPDDVLISKLQEESVILNLDSERYFGLDDVGTRILSVLTTSDSIEAAYQRLVEEYDVDGQALRLDLAELIENLLTHGLLQISRGSVDHR